MPASRPKRIRRRLSRLARRLRYSILRPARGWLRALLVRYAQGKSHTAFDPSRVTFILSSAWGMGGTIRAVHNVAGYLAATHDVEILSLVRRREDAFFGLPAGVTVTAIDDLRENAVPRGLRRVRDYLAAKQSVLMDSNGFRVETASLWMDIQLARRLRGRTGFVLGTRPALNFVVAELSPPDTIKLGEEHLHLGAYPPELQESIRERYPALDALVVLTEADRAQYEQHLGGSIRVASIPNWPSELPGAKSDLTARRVVTAGRLAPQKGFDLLIDAWAGVASVHDDWLLRICGKGPLRRELNQQIARLGLETSVELPGARDMGVEMTEASIFALSSRFEGFPLVLLEAMSKGLAVVAFDCPTGPRELVRDGENGVLVPDGDVEGLAEGIRRLIDEEALRRRCAAGAIETVKEYTMEVVGPRWPALFEELRATRPAG